ncbi:MAG: hypothetical protein FWE13_00100 [Firmicutes bacterium]|nr:hypothetical protein [Bacillota bacterium]
MLFLFLLIVNIVTFDSIWLGVDGYREVIFDIHGANRELRVLGDMGTYFETRIYTRHGDSLLHVVRIYAGAPRIPIATPLFSPGTITRFRVGGGTNSGSVQLIVGFANLSF